MCVGFTHSGKTTLARKINKIIPESILIDNDDIAVFLKKKYERLFFSSYNFSKKNYEDPNIKFLISKEILKFSLKAGLNIIHGSGNLGLDAQNFIRKITKQYKYKLITIYFNLPEKIIKERIKKTNKNTKCFRLSYTWNQVLEKQKKYCHLPPSKEKTTYFEINNQKDYQKVLLALRKIFNYEK
jgi:predicted kinase